MIKNHDSEGNSFKPDPSCPKSNRASRLQLARVVPFSFFFFPSVWLFFPFSFINSCPTSPSQREKGERKREKEEEKKKRRRRRRRRQQHTWIAADWATADGGGSNWSLQQPTSSSLLLLFFFPPPSPSPFFLILFLSLSLSPFFFPFLDPSLMHCSGTDPNSNRCRASPSRLVATRWVFNL